MRKGNRCDDERCFGSGLGGQVTVLGRVSTVVCLPLKSSQLTVTNRVYFCLSDNPAGQVHHS